MPITADDIALEQTVRSELEFGAAAIERAGFGAAAITVHRHARTDAVVLEIGGRFNACVDREVYGAVDIDPRRVGWNIQATLEEYADSEESSQIVRELSGGRFESIDHAMEHARIAATSAWVALRDYLKSRCEADKELGGT